MRKETKEVMAVETKSKEMTVRPKHEMQKREGPPNRGEQRAVERKTGERFILPALFLSALIAGFIVAILNLSGAYAGEQSRFARYSDTAAAQYQTAVMGIEQNLFVIQTDKDNALHFSSIMTVAGRANEVYAQARVAQSLLAAQNISASQKEESYSALEKIAALSIDFNYAFWSGDALMAQNSIEQMQELASSLTVCRYSNADGQLKADAAQRWCRESKRFVCD